MTRILFNKPYLTGKETEYIYQAVKSGQISGNGKFTNEIIVPVQCSADRSGYLIYQDNQKLLI
ncbi:hypothetical protein ACFLZD_01050 [Candidatus Neomarinimicrobiota bacterium]